ncbi:MAG: STAS domain-containing protein [Vulcanimicrobiaceae bacterium]
MADSITTLTFSDGLDISRYPEFQHAFATCPDGGSSVIVDLSEATWVDSIFMTELLLFYRKNQKLNRGMIVVAQGGVARMLALAGLDKRIRMVSDIDHALRVTQADRRRARRHIGPPLSPQNGDVNKTS